MCKKKYSEKKNQRQKQVSRHSHSFRGCEIILFMANQPKLVALCQECRIRKCHQFPVKMRQVALRNEEEVLDRSTLWRGTQQLFEEQSRVEQSRETLFVKLSTSFPSACTHTQSRCALFIWITNGDNHTCTSKDLLNHHLLFHLLYTLLQYHCQI